jgi:hypothetical protein
MSWRFHARAAAKPLTDRRPEPPWDSSVAADLRPERLNAAGERCQAVAATRRNSTPLMVTPGAEAQLVTGGAVSRACSSVSNRTIEKP